MQRGITLGIRIIKRIVLSFSVVIVNAVSNWTTQNMNIIQGMCLMSLLFITAIQLNKRMVQPKLLRLVSLLYCNQQIRRLFNSNGNTAVDLFPNILLATSIAVVLTVISETDNQESVEDLRFMLEALLYMYGDILDFMFQYGVLTLTVASFGVGLLIQTLPSPKDPMQLFFRRMGGIISTNIMFQGITSLINSTTHMKLIESVATASVLRLLLPSMESYLTYLTATQVTNLVPGIAPVMICIIMWTELLPKSSHGWVSELCTTYVILAVINYLAGIPTWGAAVILVITHYVDYIIIQLS